MHGFLLNESQKLLLPFCTRSSSLNTHKYINRQHTVYKELIEIFFFYLQRLAFQGIVNLSSHEVSGFSDYYFFTSPTCSNDFQTFPTVTQRLMLTIKAGLEFCGQRAAGQEERAVHIAPHHPNGMSKCTRKELIRFYRHGNVSNQPLMSPQHPSLSKKQKQKKKCKTTAVSACLLGRAHHGEAVDPRDAFGHLHRN